jgi:subtilisin family serine protease
VRIIVRVENPSMRSPEGAGFGADGESAAIAGAQQGLLADLSRQSRIPLNAYVFRFTPYLAMTVDAATLDAVLASPFATAVHEDISDLPDERNYSIPLMGVTTLHGQGKTGAGFTVAILDTGVDKTHPYLKGSVVSEACYSLQDPDSDRYSLCPGEVSESTQADSAMPYVSGNCYPNGCDHGTHVAGIAAGRSGISGSPGPGVAPGAKVIAVQVFGLRKSAESCSPYEPPCVRTLVTDQMKGLERIYALRDQYKIAAVNMSLGGGEYAENCDGDPRKDIIDKLRAAGIATVASAGNSGYCGALGAPACISSAVSVGATDKDDDVAGYSNSASFMSLLAPGSAIISAVPEASGGGYRSANGTSMAAPQVTGAWALLRQGKPAATVDAVLGALASTGKAVTDTGKCASVTKQRVNVLEASKDMEALSVVKTGAGAVTSEPEGIDCGAVCSARFHGGTKVTLTAAAAPGAVFDGWRGSGCSGTGVCQVTMDRARTLWAVFAAAHNHTLTVTRQPARANPGTVSSDPPGIACGPDCSASFPQGSTVTLTATAESGFEFVRWGWGYFTPCQGAESVCTFVVEGNYTVPAVFRRALPAPQNTP